MLGKFLILVLVVGFFAGDIMELTYSAMTESEPDVIVTINNDGTISQQGNLFGEELWYPGKDKEGIIRIHNQYKSIKGSNLGVGVELIEAREDYDRDMVYNSFLQHMRLTITKGKLSIFDKVMIKDKSLGQLLPVSNNENQNDTTNEFSISKNNFIDLKYKLLMDKEASNELQKLSAKISLAINLKENVIDGGNGGGNDDDNDDGNNGGGDDEKPVIIVPVDPTGKDEIIDIPDDLIPHGTPHWAHDCIVTLLRHGIIRGYPDDTIRPDAPITRAEAAVLIAKALKIEESDEFFSGYIDPLPGWARGHIIAVSQEGIFVGYPTKKFMPDRTISREEMVTVLIKGFEKELKLDTELFFTDKEDIGDWAIEYVKAGVSHEILRGYPDGSFKPKNQITRAEAFTIICKLLGLHEERS